VRQNFSHAKAEIEALQSGKLDADAQSQITTLQERIADLTPAEAAIVQLQTSTGFVDYNDLATGLVPVSVPSSTWTKLKNDKLGPHTKEGRLPAGVTRVWDPATNQFKFNELPIDTTLDGRFDLIVTTSTSNQTLDLSAFVAVGSPSAFEFPLMTSALFKSAGTYKIAPFNGMYIGSADIRDYPTEIKVKSDAACTIRVNGWYVRIALPTGV
jgi:hypothetical protein